MIWFYAALVLFICGNFIITFTLGQIFPEHKLHIQLINTGLLMIFCAISMCPVSIFLMWMNKEMKNDNSTPAFRSFSANIIPPRLEEASKQVQKQLQEMKDDKT